MKPRFPETPDTNEFDAIVSTSDAQLFTLSGNMWSCSNPERVPMGFSRLRLLVTVNDFAFDSRPPKVVFNNVDADRGNHKNSWILLKGSIAEIMGRNSRKRLSVDLLLYRCQWCLAIVLLFDAKFLKTWSVGKEIPGVSRYSLLFMFDNRSLNPR